ncbi:hypothetical protein D3C79_1116940 [compost metagenome]
MYLIGNRGQGYVTRNIVMDILMDLINHCALVFILLVPNTHTRLFLQLNELLQV